MMENGHIEQTDINDTEELETQAPIVEEESAAGTAETPDFEWL